jgi:hypothetical protein
MHHKATPILCLAVACLAFTAGVAGCSNSAAAGPARHPSVRSSTRSSTSQSTPAPKQSDASAPPTPVPAAYSPSPAPHGSGATALADGLYTDAADGTPHYVIALDVSGNDDVSGSVTFLYQDGRTDTIGNYTGKLSGGGKLSMTFDDGKALAGTYRAGQLTLTSCTSVLTWAVNKIGCRFAYHGHVP